MKRIFALLLAVIMVVGLTACGKNASNKSSVVTPGNVDFVPGELPLVDPESGTKLVIGIASNSTVMSYDKNYVTQTLEEMTGVDIEFLFFSGGQSGARTQLGMMAASGEKLPDILVGMLDDAMRSDLGNDELLIDCTPYLQSSDYFYYGSKYLALANEEELNLFWNRFKDPISGAIYGIPSISNGGNVDVCGFLGGLNADFAAKFGMNPEEIDTVEEVHEYLTKVVNEDPNGNGKKDEIGMLYFPNGNRSNIEQWIVNAYIYWNEGSFFNVTDGKIWEPFTTKEYREAYKVMHQWYQEGLISDLSFTISVGGDMTTLLDTPDCYTVGIFGGHPTVVCNAASRIGETYTNLEILDAKTDKGGYTVLRSNISMDMNVSITTDCENPDLAFRFLDHNLNPELGPMFRYGQEGVHWERIQGTIEVNGETIEVFDETGFPAGYRVMRDEWSTQTRATWHSSMNKMWVAAAYENGLNFNPGYGGFAYYADPGSRDDLTGRAVAEVKSGVEPAEKFFNIPYNAEESEVVNAVQQNLISTLNTWRAWFITGVKDPNNDNDWNDFIREMKNQGLDDWKEAAQSAYTRFMSSK